MKPYINTPMLNDEIAVISLLRENSHSLTDSVSMRPLLDKIWDARIVTLGETSRGLIVGIFQLAHPLQFAGNLNIMENIINIACLRGLLGAIMEMARKSSYEKHK